MIRVFAPGLVSLVVSILVCLVWPRTASAEPPNGKATSVQVLAISTNDADDQADALTQALRSRVRQAPGWSLIESTQSFDTLSIALRCPPTPNQACLDRIGDQLRADHYVWGTLAKQKSGGVIAELRLWTRGRGQVEASETYSENLKDASDDALRAVAGRLIAKLIGSPTTATLVVHAGTASGSVLVDGVARGKLEGGVARIAIPGGLHNVVVRVTGFSAPPQSVTLIDGGDADVSFALSPVEAAPTTETAATRPPEPAEKSPFPMRKVIGYSAVVVGAGFLVAAAIEGANWLSDKNASDQDRTHVPNTVSDVCAQPVNASAADACQKSQDASTAVKLGWIFAGVGAVLAGTGMVLVLGDHSGESQTEPAAAASKRPRLNVLPAFGAHAGQIDLRMTF